MCHTYPPEEAPLTGVPLPPQREYVIMAELFDAPPVKMAQSAYGGYSPLTGPSPLSRVYHYWKSLYFVNILYPVNCLVNGTY